MKYLELYIAIVIHLGAISAICYPLVYLSSPWSEGPTGRALMWKARSVAALFLLGILNVWTDLPWYPILKAIVFTGASLAVTYQFRVMLHLKRKSRRTNNIHHEV